MARLIGSKLPSPGWLQNFVKKEICRQDDFFLIIRFITGWVGLF